MAEKKTSKDKVSPKDKSTTAGASLYSLEEVVSTADAIQNRKPSPKTKKGQVLREALEQYVTPSPDGVRIYIAKFYDAEGDEFAFRKYEAHELVFPNKQVQEESLAYPPQGAVYCRIFGSYDRKTLDPKPLWEFPLHELDLETPDFPATE